MDKDFKIYFKEGYKGKGDKVVLAGKFSTYKNYDDLRIAIIKNAAKSSVSTLSKNDKFTLEFIDDNKINGLDYIFNKETYQYFLGMSAINKNSTNKIKLLIVKVPEFPTFKLPQHKETLEESLLVSWEKVKKELANIEDSELKCTKKKFEKLKREEEKNDEVYSELHINVVCNNCLTANFNGERFMCCECENFNLCENCFKSHKIKHENKHTMIRINKPIINDINKFNYVFEPKEFYFKNKYESFQLKANIVNIGENDLQCCFILPIRYQKNNLGCLKKTITEELKIGEKKSVNLMIKLNQKDIMENESKKVYEGYYRMFTEEGIPFGDVLYVKVVNDE